MSDEARSVLEAALRLPVEEQESLSEALLDALGPPTFDTDKMTDEEYDAELDRRAAEVLSGKCLTMTWEEVLRESEA